MDGRSGDTRPPVFRYPLAMSLKTHLLKSAGFAGAMPLVKRNIKRLSQHARMMGVSREARKAGTQAVESHVPQALQTFKTHAQQVAERAGSAVSTIAKKKTPTTGHNPLALAQHLKKNPKQAIQAGRQFGAPVIATPDIMAQLERSAFDKLNAAHKLHGHMKFQGLDISIENRKGSIRRWHDPHGKETGSTKMHYAYGYIKKTKGTDGDHVDVYLGPNLDATHAFIVNQMKKPQDESQHAHKVPGGGLTSYDGPGMKHTHTMPGGGKTGPYKAKGNGRGDHVHDTPKGPTGGEIFKPKKAWTKFDEQKVMLGFGSAKEAKAAYMRQYNDPRFFGSLKAMSMDEFREKVLMKSNHGRKVASKEKAEKLKRYMRVVRGGTLGGAGAMLSLPVVEALTKKKLGPGTKALTILGGIGGAALGQHQLEKRKESQLLANPNDPLHVPPSERRGKKKVAVLSWVKVAAQNARRRMKPPVGEVPATQEDSLASPALAVQPSTQTAKMANMAAITAGGGPGPSGPPQAPALRPPASGRPPAPLQPHRAMSMMPTAGRGAGAPAGNAMSMGAAAGPPSAGKGPSPAPKLAETLDMGDAYPASDEDLVPASERQEKQEKMRKKAEFKSQFAMAKVSDAHGNTLGIAMPKTAKVASLALACGLAPYQVHSAVFIGSAMVKRSGLLGGGLAIAGVGTGLYAGKKAIDTTKRLADRRHGVSSIRKLPQTPGVMGRRSTSGGY